MIRRLLVLGFAVVLVTSLFGTAIAGPDKTGQAVAFARIDGGSGALTAFGGKGTISASGVRNSAGSYSVAFIGHFPKTITTNQVIINTTAESSIFGVSNGVVTAASKTEIDVSVATWVSSTLTETDNTCFVSVFVGR
ncbi:MAG: hypothetical protein WA740_08600 [Candidatus Binataceae bacterium]